MTGNMFRFFICGAAILMVFISFTFDGYVQGLGTSIVFSFGVLAGYSKAREDTIKASIESTAKMIGGPDRDTRASVTANEIKYAIENTKVFE